MGLERIIFGIERQGLVRPDRPVKRTTSGGNVYIFLDGGTGTNFFNTFIHCFVELEVFLLTATALSSSIFSVEISGNLVESTFCSF